MTGMSTEETWEKVIERDADEFNRGVSQEARTLIGQKVKEWEEMKALLVTAGRDQGKRGRGAGKANALLKQIASLEEAICMQLEGLRFQPHLYLTLPDARRVSTKFASDKRNKRSPWRLQIWQK